MCTQHVVLDVQPIQTLDRKIVRQQIYKGNVGYLTCEKRWLLCDAPTNLLGIKVVHMPMKTLAQISGPFHISSF